MILIDTKLIKRLELIIIIVINDFYFIISNGYSVIFNDINLY